MKMTQTFRVGLLALLILLGALGFSCCFEKAAGRLEVLFPASPM